MTGLRSQLITVENRSTELSPAELFNLVWAVNYQILYHYGRSRWVTGAFAPAGHLLQLPAGAKPPVGAWNLIVLDNSDQQGALGYHGDKGGNDIPYAEIFVIDAINDGATVSAVASHEALEMLVDPFVDEKQPRSQLRKDKSELYIVEVGDPVQGNDYDVGAPEGRSTGTLVADFALPAWWKMEAPGVPGFSFRKSVGAAWEIAPQGYMSVAPANDPTNWSQLYGDKRSARPAWASRLPRIHSA